jgi:carboxymethylenebutenolidase
MGPTQRFTTDHGEIDGHLATPTGTGPWPGVVVLHDLFGMAGDVRPYADRFAAEGYLTFAPRLYGTWPMKPVCLIAVFGQARAGRGVGFERVMAARDVLLRQEQCTGKVGVAGFCLGGAYALVASPGFTASAPYYGQLPKDATTIERACPIVANYGDRDRLVKEPERKQLETALAKDAKHRFKLHEGVGHSFANQTPGQFVWKRAGFGYDREASEDAWSRVMAFFGEHLGRPNGRGGEE